MHESFAPYETIVTSGPSAPTRPLSRGLLQRIAAWVKSCADHYAAATAYEELSRLSDAELKRRGLSRDILVRDVILPQQVWTLRWVTNLKRNIP